LAEENNYEVIIEDGRDLYEMPNIISADEWHKNLLQLGISAHEFVSNKQAQAATAALTNLMCDGVYWPRGIFSIATGGGKTSLLALILQLINKPSVIILGRLDLMYQTKEVLEDLLQQDIGIWGDTIKDPKKHTILMQQTAARKEEDEEFLKWLKTRKVLCLDEAHHLTDGATLHDITQKCVSASYRFAFTATPLRRGDTGDAQLIATFGDILYEVKSKEYRDAGALAEVKVKIFDIKTSDLTFRNGNKIKASKIGIMDNSYRHDLIIDCAEEFKKKKYPTLILCDKQTLHQESLVQRFQQRVGVTPEVINYKTPKKIRRDVLNRLESGELPYIVASSGIFGEGINAPNIRALIRAEGGSSEIRTLQAAGRGMRRKPDPNVLYLVDFWDLTHKGLETDSRIRLAVYEEEEFDVEQISTAKQLFSSEVEEV
jgi:superfamily II DNA or RNA helicase